MISIAHTFFAANILWFPATKETAQTYVDHPMKNYLSTVVSVYNNNNNNLHQIDHSRKKVLSITHRAACMKHLLCMYTVTKEYISHNRVMACTINQKWIRLWKRYR